MLFHSSYVHSSIGVKCCCCIISVFFLQLCLLIMLILCLSSCLRLCISVFVYVLYVHVSIICFPSSDLSKVWPGGDSLISLASLHPMTFPHMLPPQPHSPFHLEEDGPLYHIQRPSLWPSKASKVLCCRTMILLMSLPSKETQHWFCWLRESHMTQWLISQSHIIVRNSILGCAFWFILILENFASGTTEVLLFGCHTWY